MIAMRIYKLTALVVANMVIVGIVVSPLLAIQFLGVSKPKLIWDFVVALMEPSE